MRRAIRCFGSGYKRLHRLDTINYQGLTSFENFAPGAYTAYVIDENGCVQVICAVLSDLDISSITEISAELSVYPNPTQGMIYVNASDIRTLHVYDLSGKRLELPEMTASNGIALDFSTAAAGMYVLEITTLNGDVLRTQVIKN